MTDDLTVALAAALASARFDLHDEKACQADIDDHLRPMFPTLRREPRLSRCDIPDFMVADVVIEVKMNRANATSVERQLTRYARHDEVRGIVLATNRAMNLPRTILGKPLYVVSLGRAHL